MHSYQAICVDAITSFDGYVAQYLGDGLLVYFGYPTAHEDDPARVVRAGLAIAGRGADRLEWAGRLGADRVIGRIIDAHRLLADIVGVFAMLEGGAGLKCAVMP